MKLSRRDLFIGGAGVATGLVFSPVPWKLLGDVSIWTQNWPWIPQPAREPVETKQSVCTLCAGGCGVGVRMVGGWAVGVCGQRGNPLTKGALCPLGFAAQQLNWHPQRLREVRHRGQGASWEEAHRAFERACADGPVAIVDARPGRAASTVLEAFAAKHNGRYQVLLGSESRALLPYAEWSGVPVSALGYDFENARTIVSFGTPLLDGWGIPGRFTHLWSERAAGSADPQLRLIQIEPSLSRTAARAWRWIPLRPGSETALASGLARVLLEERLVTAEGPLPEKSLSESVAETGLSMDAIRDLARTMVACRPVLVITQDANPAVAALNVLLGAVGSTGGIVSRNKIGAKKQSPRASLELFRAVLLDATVPWEFSPPAGTEAFRFAAWDGGGHEEDWLLPAPGFLEELTDVPTPPTSGVETYAIALNLLAPSEGTKTPAQFLAQIDTALPDTEKLIHQRCEAIWKARAGAIYAERPMQLEEFESAQKTEEQLRKGSVWLGTPPPSSGLRCASRAWPSNVAPSPSQDWTAAWSLAVLPPLAAKLYQESTLREHPRGRRA
jgi:Molybdopterin oxidoreductase/Molybdopterin oxidoreductase Fe4S4 domain